MGKPYSEELDLVPATLQWEAARSIGLSFAPPRDRGAIVLVGSGGSFTAADFGARAFQSQRRQLCVAASTLEYLQRSSEFGSHHAVLLSAEGKNSDICSAAAAALSNANSTTALTFRAGSPLQKVLNCHVNTRLLEAEGPWGKDGYLATNSLIASCMVLASINGLEISIDAAIKRLHRFRKDLRNHTFADEIMGGRRVLAIHGTMGAPAAIDLESKFAESAFGTVQRTDLRQFAHGRHIQLVEGREQYTVVAYIDAAEVDLWAATLSRLPREVPVLTCLLPTRLADAAMQGLLFTFALIEVAANRLGVDPGQPKVPEFAREIHTLEATRYVRPPERPAENVKLVALARKGLRTDQIFAALDAYVDRLANARFKGLVLDFDGTCCETVRRWDGLQPEFAVELDRLLHEGMGLAFASGRGDSLHADLRSKLSERIWSQVLLGCHSGSSRVRLSDPWKEGELSASMRTLAEDLARQSIDKGTYNIRCHAGQFTIESNEELDVQHAFLVACQVTRNHFGWRTFRSAHSIDVLAPEANKLFVAQWLAQDLGVDIELELLRIGDRGEAFGNDTELLATGLSLSVDGVSTDEDTCWLFGDSSWSSSQRALAYLKALQCDEPGYFRFNTETLKSWVHETRLSVRRLIGDNT